MEVVYLEGLIPVSAHTVIAVVEKVRICVHNILPNAQSD